MPIKVHAVNYKKYWEIIGEIGKDKVKWVEVPSTKENVAFRAIYHEAENCIYAPLEESHKDKVGEPVSFVSEEIVRDAN